ncbi:MAG: carboxypeptidase regulatory-like domain-containing protein, partial [Deltaproteobacteria bacterium]
MHGISRRTMKTIRGMLLAPLLLSMLVGCGEEGVIVEGEESGGTVADEGGIVGIVLDDALAPVANATISVPAYGRVVLSGADGRFSLGVLPPGAYRLRVAGTSAFGGECSTSFADLYVSDAPYLFPILLVCAPLEGGEAISTLSG